MGLLRSLLLSIIANGLALYLVAYLLPEDFVIAGGIKAYAVLGIAIGFLNTIIKPLLKLVTFPLMILTLGLFSIVINMLILWLLEYLFASGSIMLSIEGGLKTLLITSVLLGILNSFTRWLFK